MEELKRVQGSRFDEFSRRRLIEDRDTINELTARIQEIQNEINCMNDSRDFQDAESVPSPTFPVNQRFFPPFRDPGGMLSRSVGMPSRNDKPPDIWDTHGIWGNVFVNPKASSSSPYPGGFNPWISNVTEPNKTATKKQRSHPESLQTEPDVSKKELELLRGHPHRACSSYWHCSHETLVLALRRQGAKPLIPRLARDFVCPLHQEIQRPRPVVSL